MKPTKEQIRWLWEQCEFTIYVDGGYITWYYHNGKIFGFEPPTIDLNNLFKYAVPVVIDKIMAEQECSSDVAYAILFKRWLQELELNIQKPALTLYQVCYEALGGKE